MHQWCRGVCRSSERWTLSLTSLTPVSEWVNPNTFINIWGCIAKGPALGHCDPKYNINNESMMEPGLKQPVTGDIPGSYTGFSSIKHQHWYILYFIITEVSLCRYYLGSCHDKETALVLRISRSIWERGLFEAEFHIAQSGLKLAKDNWTSDLPSCLQLLSAGITGVATLDGLNCDFVCLFCFLTQDFSM